MTTLQQIRGIYERIVIDMAGNVDVFVENQSVGELDALFEYCIVRVSFGLMQELNVGCEATEHVRGSLVCEIYTQKGKGPGRGLEIAQPIIQGLCLLNSSIPQADQDVIPRVGQLQGPTQASPTDRPHHFTRFSMPIYARVAVLDGVEPQPPTFIFDGDWL
jgi:hypothetical protein